MKGLGKHKLVEKVSTLMIIMMILSLIITTNIMVDATAKDEQNRRIENKVDAKLLEAYKEKDYVRYLVILKDQTDTKTVANKAKSTAKKQSLSNTEVKQTVQQAVVSELQANAEATQQSILSYLKKDKKNIQDYQSFYIINGLAVTGTEKSAKEIANLPEVKSVILDGKQKLPKLEDTEKTLDDIEWNIDRVGAPEAWENGVTGEGTVVANIDSGVEGNHPALKEKYRGFNPDDPDNPTHEFNWYDAVSDRQSPMDSDGHGTHTMGTVVGEEDGNQIGIAPGAKWISARAFFGDETHDSYILGAAEWVLAPTDEDGVPHPEKAPDVVNNSWGGNPINNDWFLPMVEAWRSVGIVPVFSVGNAGLFQGADPGTASAPGNYKEVIAVGATDEEDNLADFSLRGPSEEGVIKPDLTAPGTSIRSSMPGESFDEFDYGLSSGTSMAAPHVVGAISLMKDVDPELTIEEIETTLKLTANTKTDDNYAESPNNGYGYGILDAFAAVEAVQQGIGTIEGQITMPGQDEEPPTYEHIPREVVFTDRNETFSIQAMDNVSVNKVTLTVLFDNESEKTYTPNLVDGDHLNGNYEAHIPTEDLVGDELIYWWTIEDFSGNTTTTDEYTVKIEEAVTSGYFEDFEAYPDGWYSYGTNNSWEWGTPKYGPESAASGEKVMGTDLLGKYEMNSDMTLMMPPVSVEENTILRFKNWYELGQIGEEMGTVFASVDGESWEPLYQARQENKRWHEIGLDLSDYVGEKIHIAFNLKTADNENAGWYIDDVQLVNDSSKSEITNQLYDEKASLTLPTQDQDDETMDEYIKQEEKGKTDKADELPAEATITVEETGWETETNSKNGQFSIHHTPGEYTLHIDAYGFETETTSVTLDEKGLASPKIQLTPLPEQMISGKVTSTTGEQIEDAKVFLLEDEHAEHAQSAEGGTYNLNAYEGTYTLKVYADGYYGKTESITVQAGENIRLDLKLEPFYNSDSSEIKYDNGDYGKNLAFGKQGNGFAVRMSLAEGETSAMLTGAKLQFWADHVPVPGGDDILISVYDAKGEDGAPGNKLAGPIEAKAKRDLYSWTEVDLSHLGIFVEDDFYIAYLQADDYPYVPGFVTDGDSFNFAERSWDYIGGQWFQAEEDTGNYMIRADVDYGEEPTVTAPVITSPDSGVMTNNEKIDVEGTATPETTLQLNNNGEEVVSVEVGEDGSFTIPITLAEGENEFVAHSIIDGKPVAESDAVTVTLDTESPNLSIESPQDGETIESEVVTVMGTVQDEHLDRVEVNGQEASVDENNRYSKEITLAKGEQAIEVVARDLAGNVTQEEITVFVEQSENAFEIENVTPYEDVFIDIGESVKITFDSEPGLRATFIINMPLIDGIRQVGLPSELPMMEMADGHYVGYWTAPMTTTGSEARIQVKGLDTSDNEVVEEAEGRLFIN